MTTKTTEPERTRSQRAQALVRYLTQERRTENGEVLRPVLHQPGKRADIKRCLGLDLDARQYDRAWGHLTQFLPDHKLPDEERAFAAVAAMICTQGPVEREQDIQTSMKRRPDRPRNLGASLAHSAAGRGVSVAETAVHRLILIGRQNVAGVHRLVPRTALHLRKQGVAVDWAQLICDLAPWRRHHRTITRRWIQDFHRTLHHLEYRDTDSAAESETK